MCLRVSYKKKIWKKQQFFASFKSLKKVVGSGPGSICRIRIRTKVSRIPNTDRKYGSPSLFFFLSLRPSLSFLLLAEMIKTTKPLVGFPAIKQRDPLEANPKKTWCMGPCAGVHSRVDSNTFTMGNPMPQSTLALCQSRLYPPVRGFGFGLRFEALTPSSKK